MAWISHRVVFRLSKKSISTSSLRYLLGNPLRPQRGVTIETEDRSVELTSGADVAISRGDV